MSEKVIDPLPVPENRPSSTHAKVSERSQFRSFKLACGTEISLSELESAGISYVPCTHKSPMFKYAQVWDVRLQVNLDAYKDQAHGWNMSRMQGVQIMTGRPTYQADSESPDGYQYLGLLDIEARFIERHPDDFNTIDTVFREACHGTPCIVQSKGGGRHYYFYCPFLAPKIEFHDKADDKMLVEIFSRKGLGRLDDRYRSAEGSIFDIPHIPKATVEAIYQNLAQVAQEKQNPNPDDAPVVEHSQLGDLDLLWTQKEREGQFYIVSQYFPLAYCPVTSHDNQTDKKVQFEKLWGGVRGYCFNCRKEWWEIEPTFRKSTQRRSYRQNRAQAARGRRYR